VWAVKIGKFIFFSFLGLIGVFFGANAVMEMNFQRLPNQMEILSDHVGGFSCEEAVYGKKNFGPVVGTGDFFDELTIEMPQSCVDRLEALVRKSPQFRYDLCSRADECWTNAGTRRTFIELHFMDEEIILRHGRI
jgi:hypothetical protein